MKYFLTLFLYCAFGTLNAQDEHFSQFFAIPIHLNPALSGAYEGTYRMTAIYRDQWNNALESPYKTFAAGGDTKFFLGNKKQVTDHFGLGLFFVSDRVVKFQMNTNKISGYFSYHKKLGDRKPSYLGVGTKFGIIQRNVNYDNVFFQDQFNQIDAFNNATQESLPPNNIGVFDLSVGLNYFVTLEKSKYYLGAAIHHVSTPNISFFSKLANPNPSIDLDQKLNRKLTVHLSLDRSISYRVSLQPRLVYQKQGEDNQIDLGFNVEYTLESQKTGLIAGLWFTGLDDLDGYHMENVTPLVGIRQGQFILGLSYDIHLRDTLDSVFGFNTFELSIRFSGEHSNENSFCPTF